MKPDLPANLKLEVKTSRSGAFSLDRRDLDGIGTDGYVATLLVARTLKGPWWVLIPGRRLGPGAVAERTLFDCQEERPLAERINEEWSNWILDREACDWFLNGGPKEIREKLWWCRKEHPPRRSALKGARREAKLNRALADLRSQIDALPEPTRAAQFEGHLHQALVEDALREIGYSILPNPVGVPDICANLTSR